MTEMHHVLVMNQYAVPRSQSGGTRHIDIFGRLGQWQPLILASSRHHATQEVFTTDDPRFCLIATPAYQGNSNMRVIGLLIYAFNSVVTGMRIKNIDLIYASSPQLLAVAAGFVLSRLRRLPLVMEVRDLWPESIVAAGRLRRGSLLHKVLVRLEIFLYRHSDRIVVVTDGWKDHFSDFKIPSERVVVIPNGTEPSDFECLESRDVLREQLSIHGFTAVYAGSHGPKDGVELVLDAAAKMPEVEFLLVGSGPSKAGCVARVDTDGLRNVEFRDPVPKQELAALLRACDVGVHTVAPLSVFDLGMSPNKLFDYMAAALPIASNAEVALSHIMRDGECGRLGSPSELADCLSEVYQASAAQKHNWGLRSLEIVTDRYSRSAAAQLLQKTLDATLREHYARTASASV